MSISVAKELSPFAQAALALDQDFAELDRLSGQLERLPLESDQDFDYARKLLARFGECGERIGPKVQALAQSLEDARARAEHASQVVTERATLIQERQKASGDLISRFQALSGQAAALTEAMTRLQGLGQDELQLRLSVVGGELDSLIALVTQVENDAREAGLKGLSKNAEAVRQSIQAARLKLGS
jgi:hypothetical protein